MTIDDVSPALRHIGVAHTPYEDPGDAPHQGFADDADVAQRGRDVVDGHGLRGLEAAGKAVFGPVYWDVVRSEQ